MSHHPKDCPPEPDHPMLIHGVEVQGDPLVMLDGLIEEFARIGWDAEMIRRMFDDPFYAGPHGVTGKLGRDAIHRRIDHVLARCEILRVREIISDDDESIDDEPTEQLVGLTIGGRSVAAMSCTEI